MRAWRCRSDQLQAIGAVYTLVFLLFAHRYLSPSVDEYGSTQTLELIGTNDDIKWKETQLDLGGGVATLTLKLKSSQGSVEMDHRIAHINGTVAAVGEHLAQFVIHAEPCAYPRFYIRLAGDALVPFTMTQGQDDQRQVWKGHFVIPLAGIFTVDARWFGCDPSRYATGSSFSLELLKIRAVGSRYVQSRTDESLFANGVWIAKSRLPLEADTTLPVPHYIWTVAPTSDSPSGMKPDPADVIKVENKELGVSTVVSKRGTLKPTTGMYNFDDNGNYELVCFWGGPTVWKLWQIFLLERKLLSPGQRPFKFHYYNVTSFRRPDRDWPLSEKKRSRKCKHIFFSMDEFIEPVSQAEFKEQLSTFVSHLVKMLNDSTFPIWILTTTEPAVSASSCHSPELPRTTDHPCNDAIKRLFHASTKQFTGQVLLMDNTDLVLPTFDENRLDILANIAMRVFVAVGKGVSDWRAMGQRGLIDGLHRNGTVEPNPELFPYEGWNEA